MLPRHARADAMGADVEERDAGGYSVTYGRDEIQAPVYFIAFLAAVLLAAGLVWVSIVALALGVAAVGFAYYNFPLIERRPIVGANQYGLFIQGLGLIRCSAIYRIHLVEIAVLASTIHELQIAVTFSVGRWRSAHANASVRAARRLKPGARS